MRLPCSALAATVVLGLSGVANAATLPAHEPLSILVISDEVNPHGLSPGELTQPGDISAAIEAGGSGISVASIDEVDSQCIDDALAALAGGVDVVIYFAHLEAMNCGGGSGQAALTTAMTDHLEAGGGVVVFHHGSYEASGKNEILNLLGVTASSIAWDTTNGQTVINTGGDHFVTTNEVEYPEMRDVGGNGFGVDPGSYPAFVNLPDERYPAIVYQTQSGEERTTLFIGDDGAALGYDLWRPAWAGHVVMYQPGEYQPNALDALDGNNFQILANAIYYVATTQEEPTGDGGDDTGGDGTADAGDGGDGGDGADAGDATDGGDGGDGGDGVDVGDGGDGADDPSGGSGSGSDGAADGGGDGGGGCGCRSSTPAGAAWLMLLALLGLQTRPRRAR